MVSWPGRAGARLACSFGLSDRALRGPSVRMSLRNWGRLPQKDEKGLGDKHGFESPSRRWRLGSCLATLGRGLNPAPWARMQTFGRRDA